MRTPAARLVIPILQYEAARLTLDPFLRWAQAGVGGFCIFGGGKHLPAVLARLQEAAPHPLLFVADLEHGAGQQLHGCTLHPPAAALDQEAAAAAAALTALEARAQGVTMTFAPVCDVLSEPRNPILNARCFSDPVATAPVFCRAARRTGLRTCAKHFPGHGGTRADSHDALPHVADDAATWARRDLPPFQACFEAGVDAVMSAHIDMPALTEQPGLPATLSSRVMTEILREELGFAGTVFSDALLMDGVRGKGDEGEVALAAFAAGCDVLLGPHKPGAVLRAIEGLRGPGVDSALARIDELAKPLEPEVDLPHDELVPVLQAAAERSITASRGVEAVGPGRYALRILDLHGEGRVLGERSGFAWQRYGLDGRLLEEEDEGPGLGGIVLCVARRDKASGGPVEIPRPIRRVMQDADLTLLFGPSWLAEDASAPHLHAPGEDPFTVAAMLRRAHGA